MTSPLCTQSEPVLTNVDHLVHSMTPPPPHPSIVTNGSSHRETGRKVPLFSNSASALTKVSSPSAPAELASSRSASQPPLSTRNSKRAFSISTFLRNEIEYIDVAQSPLKRRSDPHPRRTVTMVPRTSKTSFKSPLFNSAEQTAEQRIFNFFWLFFKLEKLLFFGFWICCDSFLMMITILPTRVLCRMYMKMSFILRREWHLIVDGVFRYYALYTLYAVNAKLSAFGGTAGTERERLGESAPENTPLLEGGGDQTAESDESSGSEHRRRDAVEDEEDELAEMLAEYEKYGRCLGEGVCHWIWRIVRCGVSFQFNALRSGPRSRRRGGIRMDAADPEWLFNLKRQCIRKRLAFGDRHGVGYEYTARDYLDGVRILTLLLCVYVLTLFNLSQIYHFIRAQENFKLYVLFKIIVIIEHLASSFGEDSTEALFNSLDPDQLACGRVAVNLAVYVCYNVLHSLLLYGHLITLNAAMNSPNNTLITILVADNFYELKSTVFKKYALENLFQMLCSDIVERFTIFLFVLLILMQNLCYLGWDSFNAEKWVFDALQLFVIMLGMEMIVDTAKHGFICKFNNFSVAVYDSFYLRLSIDVTNARRMKTENGGHCHPADIDGIAAPSAAAAGEEEETLLFFMDRRLGFSSLPLVSILLRVVWQANEYNAEVAVYVKVVMALTLFVVVYAAKLLLSLIMIAKSIKKITRKQNHNSSQLHRIAKRLCDVRRYSLIIKKIPI